MPIGKTYPGRTPKLDDRPSHVDAGEAYHKRARICSKSKELLSKNCCNLTEVLMSLPECFVPLRLSQLLLAVPSGPSRFRVEHFDFFGSTLPRSLG